MKRLAIAILMFASLSAVAQNKTIDFTQTLTGFDGKPLLEATDKPWTLSDVAVASLVTTLKDEDTLPSSKKFGFYELARKVYNNKAASLTVEEIATLKERIGKQFPTALMGPALVALDPNATVQSVAEPAKK